MKLNTARSVKSHMKIEESAENFDVYKNYETIDVALGLECQKKTDALNHLKTTAKQYEEELRKLEKVRNDIHANELDTTDIDEKITSKKTDLEKTNRDCIELTENILTLKQEEKKNESVRWVLEYAKEIWKYPSIKSIEDIRAVYPYFSITIETTNGTPTLLHAHLLFDDNRNAGLKLEKIKILSTDKKVLLDWFPEELRWIPSEWLSTQAASEIRYTNVIGYPDKLTIKPSIEDNASGCARLYFLKSENCLLSINSVLYWRTKNYNYSMSSQSTWQTKQQPEWFEHEKNISNEILCFDKLIIDEATSHNYVLDLNETYPEHSLFMHLQKLVSGALIEKAENPFPLNIASLKSEEIYQKIKTDWDAFVNGPWLPEMRGLLANLKYYCERGERPRFYSNTIENSYGFRLRTRDHSWIIGNVYILPEVKPDQNNFGKLELRKEYGEEFIFKIGKLCVSISGEEKITE